MKIRSLAVGILVIGAMATVAAAQAPAAAAEPKPKAEHARKAGKPDRTDPGARDKTIADQQVERLTKDLGLSAEQQDNIRKLITNCQQQKREQNKTQMKANGDKVKDLRQQMVEAKAAKDKEKVKALDAQMRELMGDSQTTALKDKLMADIEATLAPEQKTKFQQIKGDVFGIRSGVETRPELLMRAIDSLNLPKERQEKIRAIADEWRAKARGSQNPKAAVRAEAPDVTARMMALLTPEEQAKVKVFQPIAKHGEARGEGKENKTKEGGKGHKGRKHASQDANAPGATPPAK